MTRAAVLAGAVSDARQIAVFDRSSLTVALALVAEEGIKAALVAPEILALGDDGISQFEAEVAELAFVELVVGLWPEIVKAYRRGAGESGPPEGLPDAKALRMLDNGGLVALIDSLRMKGVRETLHGRAWGFASSLAVSARRLVALTGRGRA